MSRDELRIFVFVTAMYLTGCQSIARDPLFKLTLKAIDDDGAPVSGALARIGAERRPQAGESGGQGVFAEGLTDADGYFSGEVAAWNARRAGYQVRKEGHYGVWLSFRADSPISGKWQPWNPTIEVMLKKKRNPVGMFAKYMAAEIPVSDADLGYDLVAGDWVAPLGKGQVPDMVFHGTGLVTDDRNYRGELLVSFPGQGNGFIPIEIVQPDRSPLRMPYEAPADGYQPKRSWRSVRKYNAQTMKNEEYLDDSRATENFFIRVRSELDADGKVLKAMYGKIHAPFIFDARGIDPWGSTKRQYVSFTYYLNPDGTRNIEYDPMHNLLKSSTRHDSDYENLAP